MSIGNMIGEAAVGALMNGGGTGGGDPMKNMLGGMTIGGGKKMSPRLQSYMNGTLDTSKMKPEELEKIHKEFEALSNDEGTAEALNNLPGVEVKGDMVNMFGFISVPKHIATMLATAYNTFLQPITQEGQSAIYKALGGEKNNNRLAQVASFGIPAAFVLGHDAMKLYGASNSYYKAANELAKQAAPLLDEIKGGHTRSDLMSIKAGDNEVLFAARQRVHSQLMTGLVTAGLESVQHAPILYMNYRAWGAMKDGRGAGILSYDEGKKKFGKQITTEKQKLLSEEVSRIQAEEFGLETREDVLKFRRENTKSYNSIQDQAKKNLEESGAYDAVYEKLNIAPPKEKKEQSPEQNMLSNWLKMMAPGLVGAIVGHTLSASYTTNQKVDGYPSISTFDMIRHLKSEFSKDPEAKSFSFPKGLTKEGTRAKSMAEYIARCFQNLQGELRPGSTIPKRQEEALMEASNKMAKAIEEGTLDVMGLVHLVGGRSILINDGQRIDLRAVDSEIKRISKMTPAFSSETPDEYFSGAMMTEQELRHMIQVLPAAERCVIGALIPPAVREHLGEPSDQIKNDNRMFGRHVDVACGHLVGLIQETAAKDDKELKTLNLNKDEIQTIRDLAKLAKEKGEDAIEKEIKKPANSHVIVGLKVNEVAHEGRMQGTRVHAKPGITSAMGEASDEESRVRPKGGDVGSYAARFDQGSARFEAARNAVRNILDGDDTPGRGSHASL